MAISRAGGIPPARSVVLPDEMHSSVITAILYETDWSEPWLTALLAFHLFNILFAVVTRKYVNAQAVYFCFLALAAYLAPHINGWATLNYKLFTTKNYFDPHGLFITVVFASPIMITCIVMICIWLKQAAALLVKVKRAELLYREKQKKKEK